jgi:succinoglycan biosynthesis protein ExoM
MPNIDKDHISVCVCTFKRPDLLNRLLEELAGQCTDGMFNFSVVVSDNDRDQSARQLVVEFAARSHIPVTYCVESQQNIALARNKALANAKGNFVAFIDDDEYPSPTWLRDLFQTCNTCGADGVLGPVVPYFEQKPPNWLIKGRFFERPTHPTGFKISSLDMRTGNVMFKNKILDGVETPFRAEFGTGGEDVDFFRRMIGKGCVFVWCNESIVYEMVPKARFKRSYLLKRALRRGNNSFKFRAGRARSLVKALVALSVYGLSLPFLFIAGDHHFMKYMIKFCDHAGLLLAFFGIKPFNEYK